MEAPAPPPARTFALSLLLLPLVMAACASEPQEEGWAGTVDTLPNGAVRVVNPSRGVWEDGGGWRLVPELSLGKIEGEEWEIFAQVSGMTADDGGRIYVLDRQENVLRIFSPTGAFVRSVGREGEGPGEYRNANGLEWLSPDSLLVVDQPGNRYTVLTPEGELLATMPRSLGFFGWTWRGAVTGGRIYEEGAVRLEGEYHPALLGTSLSEVGWGPEDAPVQDTVMLPLSDAPPYESYSIRTDRGGMSMGVPFAPASVYHLTRDGHLWHGHGSEPRIFRSTLAGDTLMEVVLSVEGVPVMPEEVEEWAAGPSVQRFEEMGGDLDLGRIPDLKPYFEGFYRDPDGYLWVMVPSHPGEVLMRIIDPDGRYLGTLRLEGFERTPWLDPVLRNDRLYLVGQDELDVQHVNVFRIER